LSERMLRSLAPLPATATQLLALLENPDVPWKDMAAVAVHDVGLSARMLRLANSAMFGMRGRVGSIVEALRLIGTAGARMLVLTSGISEAGQAALPVYGLDKGGFIKHSELVANL